MNRRTAFRLATLTAVSVSLLGASIVQASPRVAPFAGAGLERDADRDSGNPRGVRRIDVGSLPPADDVGSSGGPRLARPDFPDAGPPDVQGGAPAPVQATNNGDAVIDQATAFEGMAFQSGTPTSGEPPDPFVAVGPEHVVQIVNTQVRISDRTGNALETADLFDFFGLGQFYDPGDVDYFDPRVIYDSLHARWIAIEVSFDCFPFQQSTVGSGYLDIAVSDGPDPTGGWEILSIYYPDALPDYPGLGTSTDKVVASANVFALAPGGGLGCEPDSFLGTEMDVLAWSEITDANDDFNVAYLYSPVVFANNYFSWRPALQTPATSSTVFAIAERGDFGVAYARITGSPAGGGATNIAISNLTGSSVVAPFAVPPEPQQPGSPATIVRAVDERPTDAIWKDNRLAWVSTYPCDASGSPAEDRDCVRVSEVSTATPASPTLIQDFLIAQNNFDLYMGGIGYAINDDLHVVWTRSSEDADNYASSFGAYQTAEAPVNTIGARRVLSLGLGTYPGQRWGDYVGVAQDPQVPNAVWQGNQYSAGANYWATEVTQLQTGGTSYTPIEPLRVLDSRPAYQIGLSGVFAANTPRTFQVAGVGIIPADAVAVTGNLTVANQTAAGYVSVTPTPVANPISSTINFPLGDTRANNLTIPLSATGTLSAVYKAPNGRSTHLILDITGYYLAGDSQSTYTPMTPVRVLDSRPAYKIGIASAFLPNQPKTLSIAGANTIPADAVAITGNLTVVGQTRAGYLSITPDPEPNPTTSTLNFPLADTRANGVTVPLNDFGDLSIVYKASGGSTHVILDVTGYYLEDPGGLLFYPLTPGRLMDTRPIGVLSGLSGAFGANNPRTLQTDGHWGVPLNADAITGNLTVVGQTAAGYVSITPTQVVNPTTSTINFPLGDVRANGVAVPLNGSGNIALVYKAPGGRTTHLIFDLSGYFK